MHGVLFLIGYVAAGAVMAGLVALAKLTRNRSN